MAYALRSAARADIPALRGLMQESVRRLSVGYYDAPVVQAALTHRLGVDTQLLDDGTYFVIEDGETIAAAGSAACSSAPAATRPRPPAATASSSSPPSPGEPLYLALGFDRLDEVVVPLPGGLEMRGWRMGRSLDGPQSPC